MASIPKGQREQILILIMVASVALIGLYWWFPYRSKAADLDAKSTRVASLVDNNQKAKAEMIKGSLDQLRKQLAEYQQNLVLVRTLVPVGNEVPSLLEQVSTAARRAGLDVATVDPQAVVEGDNFDTYRYKMTVVGNYNALGEFFSNVGNLTRIILPVNLSLAAPVSSSNTKTKQPTDKALIEARFELQTFISKTPTNDQPKPSKKGGAKQ